MAMTSDGYLEDPTTILEEFNLEGVSLHFLIINILIFSPFNKYCSNTN